MFLPSSIGPWTQFLQPSPQAAGFGAPYSGAGFGVQPQPQQAAPSTWGQPFSPNGMLSQPRAGMVPIQFPGGFGGLPQNWANPFQGLWGSLGGSVAGGMGSRGPAPNPFQNLFRFAGPFGNGGGPISPSFQPRQFGWGSPWQAMF